MTKLLLFLARSKWIPSGLRLFGILEKHFPVIIASIIHKRRKTNSSIIIDNKACIIQAAILYEGSYEPEITEVFLGLISASDSFLDIGANVGYYSALAIGANLKSVCAIEPSLEIFPSLLKNLRYNSRSSEETLILPFNLGFSDSSESLQFVPPGPSNTGIGKFIDSSSNHHGSSNLVELPVISGDQLVPLLPYVPTVIKIDVEGFELKVLNGMRAFMTCTNKPRAIFIETSFSYWEANDSLLNPLSLLSDLGYKITHIKRQNGLTEIYENFLAVL